MKKKLRNIVLIDDNKLTNFFHKKILERIDCAEEIHAFENAESALEFISSSIGKDSQKRDLIILDLNMPGMNGWEFIEEYRNFTEDIKANVNVIMLSSSINPDDKTKASEIKEIAEFCIKPLMEESTKDLIRKYFDI
jgi:CheY-like chemotaxis protein